MLIAILEDDERREAAMLEVLAALPSCCPAVLDNAPDMIKWFIFHLDEVDLICLDHDLGPGRSRDVPIRSGEKGQVSIPGASFPFRTSVNSASAAPTVYALSDCSTVNASAGFAG